MLEKRAVTRDHVGALIGLDVLPGQRDLVSPNVRTLAQAAYEPGAYVWGLWDAAADGAAPVGLMAMVHPREYPFHEPGDDREAADLWRLMIAAGYQGRGFGRAAVALALAVARDWGCPRLTLGVADAPQAAQGFYERLGFRWTGQVADGERTMTRDVGPAD
jgi:diamine N-acetyltransferase